jgi:hypothetical protein
MPGRRLTTDERQDGEVTPFMLDSVAALNGTNIALGAAVAGLFGYVAVAFLRGLIRHRRREARG